MSDGSYVLSTTGLCFSYGGRKTVDNVDLRLQPGTLTALVGPNGAGKSTLLHLLEGRLKPSQGAINTSKRIGLMPQRAAIDWSFPITAEDMVSLGSPRERRSTPKDHPKQLLERVGMASMGSAASNISPAVNNKVLWHGRCSRPTSCCWTNPAAPSIHPHANTCSGSCGNRPKLDKHFGERTARAVPGRL